MSRPDDIRKSVSEAYSLAVLQTQAPAASSCCAAPSPPESMLASLAGYSREALASLPADAVASSFGCGNPVVLAEIREGDRVLDLGSGAGIDILLAAKLVGPKGKVIGVDMTPAMIERARSNAAAAGLGNVEVREGIIEELPVEAGSVDLVLSNCVINLSPEKKRVFSEIHRVLRAGGRFSISDIVAEPMPAWITEVSALYSACISGAIPEAEYLAGLANAGLVDVAVRDRLTYDRDQLSGLLGIEEGGSCCCGSAGGGQGGGGSTGCGPVGLPRTAALRMAKELAGKVSSVRITGRKP
ncbi:MAG: arsenite methyltransferase [Polyangia bacterium]|jgi:SAM-dependent methyltransferase|nr:arsenite methyltransferase [Polyangia bacterium]